MSRASFAQSAQNPSVLQNRPVRIEMRPALEHDFAYCRRRYFDEMRWIIEESHLDRTAQETGFGQQWKSTQVRIIGLDGTDAGWVQTIREQDELFVEQMFVDRRFQRKGIGTEAVSTVEIQ